MAKETKLKPLRGNIIIQKADLKKEIEEKFFEFAYCRKCHMKANFCKCKIGQPIMELFQFEQALSTQKQEFEKMIDECSILINPTFNNKVQKGVFIEKKELKQRLGEMK